MHHLIQNWSHYKIHHKLYPDLYADDFYSVHLMTLHLHLEQLTPSTLEFSEDEEDKEDFQTVPIDDDHWTSEEIPVRTLCIYEHGLPHGLCPYPCPYANYQTPSYMDSLDLSDILDFENYMVMSSDKDIPGMEEMPY